MVASPWCVLQALQARWERLRPALEVSAVPRRDLESVWKWRERIRTAWKFFAGPQGVLERWWAWWDPAYAALEMCAPSCGRGKLFYPALEVKPVPSGGLQGFFAGWGKFGLAPGVLATLRGEREGFWTWSERISPASEVYTALTGCFGGPLAT